MKLHVAVLLSVLVAPSWSGAAESLVGQPAPPFVAETCVNRPLVVDSRELKGEVIVLEFWGIT